MVVKFGHRDVFEYEYEEFHTMKEAFHWIKYTAIKHDIKIHYYNINADKSTNFFEVDVGSWSLFFRIYDMNEDNWNEFFEQANENEDNWRKLLEQTNRIPESKIGIPISNTEKGRMDVNTIR